MVLLLFSESVEQRKDLLCIVEGQSLAGSEGFAEMSPLYESLQGIIGASAEDLLDLPGAESGLFSIFVESHEKWG